MIHFTTSKGSFLAVEVRDGATDFVIRFGNTLSYTHNKTEVLTQGELGKWQLIGQVKYLSEDQWAAIVQSFGQAGWYNYEWSEQFEEVLKKTATASGQSLCALHGIKPNDVILKMI